MRILVLADIHSNWPALSAIQEPFDVCLFTGDLVDYGVDPVPCVDWVRKHALAAVRGNHDHAVAQRVKPRPGPGFRELTAATRPLHWERLDRDRLKFLARLPVSTTVQCDGLRIALVHATPRDPMDEYIADDSASWRDRLGTVTADILCVGHTHRQFHLKLPELQVLNPGSVGQPRDGDPRCAYALIEDGVVHLRRVEYDIDWAVRQLQEAGLSERAQEMAAAVLRTGGQIPVSMLAGRIAPAPALPDPQRP